MVLLRSAVRRTWTWLRLDNANTAAELAIKLLGVLAAVIAANFFTSRGDVWVAEVAKYHQIDVDLLEQEYDGASASTLRDATRAYNDDQLLAGPFSFDTADADSIMGRGRIPVTPLVCENNEDVAIEALGESACHAASYYALAIGAVDEDVIDALNDAGLVAAIRAIEAAHYVLVRIKVKNAGPVEALNVRVAPPPGLLPLDESAGPPVELPPNQSVEVQYRDVQGAALLRQHQLGDADAVYLDQQFPSRDVRNTFVADTYVDPNDFLVSWDDPELVSTRGLRVIGAILMLIWFTVVGREVAVSTDSLDESHSETPESD